MTETVLLVGGGGREHAIARALADDCTLCACASNRNPGITELASRFETLSGTDIDAIVEFATEIDADLAVIGPEAALEAGVADALDDAGVYTFGPRAEAARIETDKAFQRQFMQEHGITGCPEFETFDDVDAACAYIDAVEHDLAVKPAGLTGGKGVKVIGDQVTREEAKQYLRESSYDRVVLEERLVGEEFTVQAFVANGDVRPTPAIQDHKRAYEGDEGPNTGGMGSYSDTTPELPFMTREGYDDAVSILEEVIEALPGYKGVLYGQFMLTADGPKVVEFNARFGDPEAMNTLPVLETPLFEVLTAARDGEPLPAVSTTGEATVCKYAVPDGYPTDPSAGARIEVDESTVGNALLFYASVDEREDGLYTTTSRSFAVVGLGESIAEAERNAEAGLSAAGDGLRVRHDVGKPDLVQRRIDHMDELRR
ncbi:Phosphoribosylamine-glycine ligase [Halalkaliarchaeum sp. AArc-CO]|uniref:phosphoribosylamine--glycine ligase n=1 Tax=unclassified Halalkaliarchaeum TaxID=2678344 RepID=UPI00217DAD00|nr:MULTISPECIES: phosphoribosylamine--glycine ligase [unclassified Halalkaliarchaeum]MDR5672255.1 phosphoribosylamine--glycine ligase [Halalkaliarchaeum sp. AArc-GB]UWG50129.1 Phosphoribosylamine-glycine ligase [Halalkaliarchaeum sp. AArc-CO]